jgi:hypothetical protein
MRLRSVMTMALACAASAAALAAAGPAAASSGTSGIGPSGIGPSGIGPSGGTPGAAARPLLVRPQSGASYEWGVATPVPGLATLDDNGPGQLSAVSCAAAGNCGATGFFRSGGATHPFVVAESGSVWDGATAVPGTGTDDSGSLAESCPVPQRCSIGGYVPAGSGREVGFLDDQLPSRDWDAALPLPGTLGDLAPADSVAKVISISCRSVGNCSAGGLYTDKHDDLQAFVVDEKNGHWHPAQEVAAKLNVKGHAAITDVSCHSAGNCAAVGYISDVTGLSCGSAGSCGIVGYYYAGPDDQQPFVAKGSIAVPTSAALTLSTATVVDAHEQSEKFSVTTKSANGLPTTGAVAIRAGSTTLCTMTLSDGAGSCRPTASRLKPGTYAIVAVLGPTQIYMSATSPAKVLKVKK